MEGLGGLMELGMVGMVRKEGRERRRRMCCQPLLLRKFHCSCQLQLHCVLVWGHLGLLLGCIKTVAMHRNCN